MLRNDVALVGGLCLFLGLTVAACSASSGTNGGNGALGSGATSSVPGAGSQPAGSGTGGVGALQGGGNAGTPILTLGTGGGAGGAPGSGGTPAAGGMPPVIPPAPDQPINVNECPGSLDPATVQALTAPGGASGAKLLYPYDGT